MAAARFSSLCAARVYEIFKSGADFRTLQKDVRAGCYLPAQNPNIGLPT
jgi:hypothetical protein